jgi:hypothetical protein
MKGAVLAEQGHFVNILAPVDVTGGKTAQAFSLKNHAHASILIQIGVSAAAFTKILVNQCTDNTGANPVAIPFSIYKQETAGCRTMCSARARRSAAGYTPSANDGIFYVIELDASELADGSPYVQLQLHQRRQQRHRQRGGHPHRRSLRRRPEPNRNRLTSFLTE